MVALALGDGTSTATPVRRASRWWVEVVEAPEAAEAHRAAWDDLAWQAIEPNPFYESWMLLPAWRRFGMANGVRLALIYRDGPRPNDPPELCGLFPLVQKPLGRWPVQTWALWQHHYAFVCTPLLRHGVAREALAAFWMWLEEQADSPAVWELPHVAADGPFQQTLIDVINDRQALCHTVHRYNRALLRPAESAKAYCAATMTCHNRQELRRQRRRLSERGRFEARCSAKTSEVSEDLGSLKCAEIATWIDRFLALEAAGWKGREETALAAAAVDAEYFREIAIAAAERRQVVFLGLFLDDRPIALKVNFLSGDGGFAFKIAFDEAFAKSSPGVQLELENIDWLHRQPGVKWMDSCAKPGHFMINRLWGERRTMQHLVVSTGRSWGNLIVGALPLVRALKSIIR
jgi:CelD/BcsL family acetyltransferase involved in cellulose biosynthesis